MTKPKPNAKPKPKAKAFKPEPLVAYRPMIHNGVYVEIGESAPMGMKKDHPNFRNFAPANIAGNMRARRQYFLKLDAKK
jgi:hypothetical protein